MGAAALAPGAVALAADLVVGAEHVFDALIRLGKTCGARTGRTRFRPSFEARACHALRMSSESGTTARTEVKSHGRAELRKVPSFRPVAASAGPEEIATCRGSKGHATDTAIAARRMGGKRGDQGRAPVVAAAQGAVLLHQVCGCAGGVDYSASAKPSSSRHSGAASSTTQDAAHTAPK